MLFLQMFYIQFALPAVLSSSQWLIAGLIIGAIGSLMYAAAKYIEQIAATSASPALACESKCTESQQ
jgi:hypothetical protein